MEINNHGRRVASVMVMLVVAAHIEIAEGITCSEVQGGVAPCLVYITRGGPTAPPRCCNSIRGLNAAAKTTADRQTACKCLQTIAKRLSGNNLSNAAKIPGLCGVKIPYKISPTTDCSSVR